MSQSDTQSRYIPSRPSSPAARATIFEPFVRPTDQLRCSDSHNHGRAGTLLRLLPLQRRPGMTLLKRCRHAMPFPKR
jgi:hypothetical protein